MSATVTVKEHLENRRVKVGVLHSHALFAPPPTHVAWLLALSRAVYVTVVTPSGKLLPLAVVTVSVGVVPLLSVGVGAVHDTVRKKPLLTGTDTGIGQTKSGGWLSLTTTLKLQARQLPEPSVAL